MNILILPNYYIVHIFKQFTYSITLERETIGTPDETSYLENFLTCKTGALYTHFSYFKPCYIQPVS